MVNTELFFRIFNLNGQFPILDQLMIFGATHLIYIMIFTILLLGLKGKITDKKAFLLILVGIPIAVLLIKIVHLFFFESRPFVTFSFLPLVTENADASFPSRHATISAVIAFAYTYCKSKWALLFLLTMLWISFARIYVGVHYPLDIAGGFAVGAVSLFLTLQLKKLIFSQILKFP